MVRKLFPLLLICLMMQSCVISYKFNGASIDYAKTKSVSVATFPNTAAMVYAQLSPMLTEQLRDIYARQTRLQVRNEGGDLELEGEITGYTLTPMAISANSYASETKLTLTIRVRFTNNINPEESFEKTYSAFQVFDASMLLTDVQEELCTTMIQEIVDNIYNDTVARW